MMTFEVLQGNADELQQKGIKFQYLDLNDFTWKDVTLGKVSLYKVIRIVENHIPISYVHIATYLEWKLEGKQVEKSSDNVEWTNIDHPGFYSDIYYRVKKEVTYRIGDRFNVWWDNISHKQKYILAQVSPSICNLINLNNGNRLIQSFRVKNIHSVTERELNKQLDEHCNCELIK